MFTSKIKAIKHYDFIYYFFIYSFIGWCWETLITSLQNGKFIKRGFILGPFCVIYGFGMIMLLIFLDSIKDKPLLYFLSSAIMITILEYATGFILEYFFHYRWWDYSNIPFNLNGYVCLSASMIWGILSFVITHTIHPKIQSFLDKIPKNRVVILSYVIVIFFLTNILFSLFSSYKYI
jgi:uncharacterized membrane protein